jgi:peptidoglycan/xylan/chitin deacetylase (PgdA/CDA1 family)
LRAAVVPGLIQGAVQRALAATGLPPLAHRLLPRQRVTILMYHAIVTSPLAVPDWSFLDERVFRLQLEYVGRHFDVVPLSEAVRRLRQRTVRRPTAVITFDDGFQSVHDVALPLLKRLGLPAAVFVVSGLVDTDGTPWYCRLNRALAAATRRSLEWRDESFALDGAIARSRAGGVLQRRLEELPHPLLMHELAALVGALGDDAQRPVGPGSPYRVLGARELQALAASGLFEFGAHGASHAILSLLPPEEREREVVESVQAVARLTGRACRFFSYPSGRTEDYDGGVRRTLGELGIEAAVTGVGGANVPTTPRLELRRDGVGADTSMAAFQLMVHHAPMGNGHAPGRA